MDAVLTVEDLTVSFRTGRGRVRALNRAGFTLKRGEPLIVIGESGSGKSVLAHALMRLLPMNAEVTGKVSLGDKSLLELSETQFEWIRGRQMALIPQGAATSLNPVRKIGSLLQEVARARGLSADTARQQIANFLAALNLDYDAIARRYPHQLSGGMQQRIVNAASMLGKPDVVIADEPTFGLDASLVETTAEQLHEITRLGSALLVITHDLRLAQRLGGRIAVIYGSYIVELQNTESFFVNPKHPYSKALLQSLPERGLVPIPGLPPELSDLPPGCPFTPRCAERQTACDETVPPLLPVTEAGVCRCVLHA